MDQLQRRSGRKRLLQGTAITLAVALIAGVLWLAFGRTGPSRVASLPAGANPTSVSPGGVTASPTVSSGAPSSAPAPVTLPTVTCKTNVHRGMLPPTVTVSVPAALAPELTAYGLPASEFQGQIIILAPSGWVCVDHIYLGDGGESVSVFPAGAGPTGPLGILPGPSIALFFPGGAGVQAGVACPFFPDQYCADYPQAPRPPGEQVDHPAPGVATFMDPAGVKVTGNPSGGPYPVYGVVVGPPNPTVTETCTLPPDQTALCQASIVFFIESYSTPVLATDRSIWQSIVDRAALGNDLVGACPDRATGCVLAFMQAHRAPADAQYFFQATGWFLSWIDEDGPVDLGAIFAPWPSQNQGVFSYVLLNGTPAFIDIDQESKSLDLGGDAAYESLLAQLPAVSLKHSLPYHEYFPGRDFDFTPAPGGGQRFVFEYGLINGCDSGCDTGYSVMVAFDFSEAGVYVGHPISLGLCAATGTKPVVLSGVPDCQTPVGD